MKKSFALTPFTNEAIKSAFHEYQKLAELSGDLTRSVASAGTRIDKIQNHTNRVSRELYEVQHEVCIHHTLYPPLRYVRMKRLPSHSVMSLRLFAQLKIDSKRRLLNPTG